MAFITETGILPDYRTIARFHSDNKEAIKQVLKQNVKLCVKLGLTEGNTLFLDGSKFQANASEKAISNAGYFSLKDLEKIPEGIKAIMPSRKQAQKENRKTEVKSVWVAGILGYALPAKQQSGFR